MKLAGYLKHLGGLVRLLGWGVPDGLAALPRLGPEAVGDLLGDVVDHGSAVDEGVESNRPLSTHSLMIFLMVV